MRTPDARARAEDALRRLLAHMGPHVTEVTVIGGLNPPLLAPVADAPHQGTVDVDLAIDLAPVYDRDDQDFGWLERALESAGFTPSADGRAWRWTLRSDGVDIHRDILCDVLDNEGQEMALPGTRSVTAMNLMGPAAAVADATVRPVSLALTDQPGAPHLHVRYAGLGGYLLAKAAAVVSRRAPKDTYDLAFVLLHCPGGPGSAGDAARRALPAGRQAYLASAFRTATRLLLDPDSEALHSYAEQRIRDGVEDDALTIRLDVATAARRSLAAFDAGSA